MLIVVAVVSWLVGVVAYMLAARAFYGETPEGADFTAVVFWSAFMCVVLFPTLYAPVLRVLRRKSREVNFIITFPLVGASLFAVPTFLIFSLFGGWNRNWLKDMMSDEAILFHCMFIAVGITFGLGFAWYQRRRFS